MQVIIDKEITKSLLECQRLNDSFRKNILEFTVINSKLNIDWLPTCLTNIIQEYYNDILIFTNVTICHYNKTIEIGYTQNNLYYKIRIDMSHAIPIILSYITQTTKSDVVVDDLMLLINTFMLEKYKIFNFVSCYYYDKSFIKQIDKNKYHMFYITEYGSESAKNVTIDNEVDFEQIAFTIKQILLVYNIT